jgi:hypothetical protein
MTQSQIAKIYNNSEVNEDGIMIHNFSIVTVDEKRLYCRENLNPTSKQGNKYSNIVKLIVRDADINQQSQPVNQSVNQAINHEVKKNNIVDQNMIMFVTGLSGRSMQGGRFAISDIPEIVRVSARSYVDIIVNENY